MSYAVVVVAWNGEQWIDACLESVLEQQGKPRIIVVDNASSDATGERARQILANSHAGKGSWEVLSLDRNFGFTIGANRGMSQALAADPDIEGILLLNQDARLEPGALDALTRYLEKNPEAGAVGARILYPDRKHLQHAGGYLERPRQVGLHYGHHEPADDTAFNAPREVDYVTGAAIMIRAACLRKLGLFDEIFSPGYYEDVEFCDRLTRNGWTVAYEPGAKVVHEESSSFTNRDSRLRFANRNRLIFALSHLRDPDSARGFVEAETDFLNDRAHRDEIRAISHASLELLARFPTVLCPGVADPTRGQVNDEISRQALVAVRHACRGVLARGIRSTDEAGG